MDMNISYNNTNRSFPLPPGEGQGEGVSGTAVTADPFYSLFHLQPLLMHIGNLQVLSLFAQLADLAHVRFQLSFVTTNDTNSYYRPLPFVLVGQFGNRGVETRA
jgi:hypothetical protein